MRERRPDLLGLLGAATALWWLSRALYPQPLWPLVAAPESEPWRHAALVAAGFRWALVAAGVAAGILVALRRRPGRALAIALAAFVLFSMAASWADVAERGGARAVAAEVRTMARARPVLLLDGVVGLAWCAAALALLPRVRRGPPPGS